MSIEVSLSHGGMSVEHASETRKLSFIMLDGSVALTIGHDSTTDPPGVPDAVESFERWLRQRELTP